MKFYMVSTPYTGTRFLRKILDDNGCPPVEQIHTFVQAKWHHWFNGPVVCPMRDPILHAITVENLGKPTYHFDGYELLASLANEQTHFFRVDTDHPAKEIAMLQAFLGQPLKVEWKPEGASVDRWGLKARYLETGEIPNPRWLDEIGDGTRALLRRLGYELPWLDA